MGLDTYAAAHPPTDEEWEDYEARFGLSDEDIAAFERAEAEIAGDDGGCTFGGNYFRGSIVSELVPFMTGVRLSQEWIPPETVRFIADAFEDCDPDETIRAYMASNPRRELTVGTIEDLRVFFRICADRHLGLVGSW